MSTSQVPQFSRAVAGHTSVTRSSDPVHANGHGRENSRDAAHVDDDGVLQCTAVESRADVENLDALQAKRRALVATYAPLAAKFKGGAIAGSDAARKRHRALIAQSILATMEQKGEKAPSEAALERMANAHVDHIEFCNALEREFTRFILAENDIADVTEQIRNREECLRVYRAELGLAR
jgi:hypothetical protein